MTQPAPIIATFGLTSGTDPEERLEEAALWKALHDEFGDDIVAVDGNRGKDGSWQAYYGLIGTSERATLRYWEDPAVRKHFNRGFKVVLGENVTLESAELMTMGRGVFLKSTRDKHWVCKIPRESSFEEAGWYDMAFSFIDGGPPVMVQELVEMTYEWRFLCIGREIVTDSPNARHLTPIDWPQTVGRAFTTPADTEPAKISVSAAAAIWESLRTVAQDIAANMAGEDAVIDCAMIDGKPGVVELNPMCPGSFGLFACDVRALARAIKRTHPRLAR